MYLLEQLQSTVGKDKSFTRITEKSGHTEFGDKKKGELDKEQDEKLTNASQLFLLISEQSVSKCTSETGEQCSD